MPNMLVVTTTMGMLDWVHGHTADLRPAVPLDAELVVSIAGLQERLLSSATTSNLSNHSTAATWNNLLSTRGKLDPGGAVIGVVTYDNRVVPRRPREHAAIPSMMLHVADHRSLGDGPQREDVADHEVGLAAAVDELARVHALGGDEELLLVFVPERVAEGDARERGPAPGVVDDVGDHALEVPVALAEVEAAEPRRALAVVGVGLEDGPRSLTLCSDHASHGSSSSGGGGWR